MSMGRRHLMVQSAALGLAAVGLLQARAGQAASSDAAAVTNRLEAFRAAQLARDAELSGHFPALL